MRIEGRRERLESRRQELTSANLDSGTAIPPTRFAHQGSQGKLAYGAESGSCRGLKAPGPVIGLSLRPWRCVWRGRGGPACVRWANLGLEPALLAMGSNRSQSAF